MTAVSTRGSSPHSLRFRYGARGDALGRRPPAPRRWVPSQPSAEAPESAGSRYPQLGNAHFDGAGPGSQLRVTVAVALAQTLVVFLPATRPGPAFQFQLRQQLGGKAIISRSRLAGSSLRASAGSSCCSSSVVPRIRLVSQSNPYRRIIGDHRKPPARYGAIGDARPGGFALPSYTHHRGHAPRGWPCPLAQSADLHSVYIQTFRYRRHLRPPFSTSCCCLISWEER